MEGVSQAPRAGFSSSTVHSRTRGNPPVPRGAARRSARPTPGNHYDELPGLPLGSQTHSCSRRDSEDGTPDTPRGGLEKPNSSTAHWPGPQSHLARTASCHTLSLSRRDLRGERVAAVLPGSSTYSADTYQVKELVAQQGPEPPHEHPWTSLGRAVPRGLGPPSCPARPFLKALLLKPRSATLCLPAQQVLMRGLVRF